MGNATLADHGTGQGGARCYADRASAMLLIADPALADAGTAAIAAAGGRLLQSIAWDRIEATLPRLIATPLLSIDTTGVAPAILDAKLPVIGRFIVDRDGSAVVVMARDQIDIVARHLLGMDARLLCEPTDGERIAALAAAAWTAPPVLHDSLADGVQNEREPYRHAGQDIDDDRLRRLTEGIAHISRYAADLSRNMATIMPGDLADRRRRYDGEPDATGQTVRSQEVRRMIHRRQQRAKFFGQFGGEALFEDPAWDMLLDLFAAELEGTQVSVSSLCIAAGVAPTTALRWIAKMAEMDLFIRHPDPVDRRRAFMTLSPRASEAMRGYMAAVRKMEAGG